MIEQQSQMHTQSQNANSLETVQLDFMHIAHELHQEVSETNKKKNAKKRLMARRAIEVHQENKRLQQELKEWWDDL